jgi:uncharacterized protein DUF1501
MNSEMVWAGDRLNAACRLPRRDWLRLCTAGVLGTSTSGWFAALADEAARQPARRRACILLWMSGGPSQMDTFDLKPGHANGGPFHEIETSVPGVKFSEHLPQLARQADQLTIIRSMTSKEGDHARATSFAHAGYLAQGPIRYPTFGSLIANQLGRADAELPDFVSIAPNRALSPSAYDPGFLGARFAPLMVGGESVGGAEDVLKVEDLRPARNITREQLDSRLQKLQSLNGRFFEHYQGPPTFSYRAAYDRAVRLMQSQAASAFAQDEEAAEIRDAYGRNRFGQGCLLARRLVERGVPFVEVTLNGVDQQQIGWDTHAENFDRVKQLSQVLDPAWGSLIKDLKQRGLLDDTLIVWMGEFGRTPAINQSNGRDHYPQAWTAVLSGGGLKNGQAIGRTSADGMTVEDRPVTIPDLLATICQGLEIDPLSQNISNVGRPIRIVDPAAQPVREILG